MAKMDWEAKRRRPRPLISFGEEREFKEQARQLAERIRKGKRGRKASLAGPVRQWTAEEIAEYDARLRPEEKPD